MLNIFQIIGDSMHFGALLLLIFKLFCTKSSSSGVSWKSLFLYTSTYCARYLDLFTIFVSYYNTIGKIYLLTGSFITILAIPCLLRGSYQKKYDTFWVELLILPVTALSLILNHTFTIMEICWTWSIYMEAVALLPQFYMTWKGGHVDLYLICYLFGMTTYRGFYIGNWAYRYYTEAYLDWISIGGGIVETIVAIAGLSLTIALYCLRKDSTGAYCPVDRSKTIYTLPFAVSAAASSITNFGKGFGNMKDQSGSKIVNSGVNAVNNESDCQSLLKMLEDDGPYNQNLSVPIEGNDHFIA